MMKHLFQVERKEGGKLTWGLCTFQPWSHYGDINCTNLIYYQHYISTLNIALQYIVPSHILTPVQSNENREQEWGGA